MSQNFTGDLFMSPGPGEAESSRMAEIRRCKRPAIETSEVEETPQPQRPRLSRAASSLSAQSNASRQPSASTAADFIDLLDEDDEKDVQNPLIDVNIPGIKREVVRKNNVLQMVRDELTQVYTRRVRQAVPETALWRKLDDIRDRIKDADKATILDRYRYVWKKALTEATKALKDELETFEGFKEDFQGEEEIETFDRDYVRPKRIRHRQAERDAKTQDDLVAYLKIH